jgi:hypothetical protein
VSLYFLSYLVNKVEITFGLVPGNRKLWADAVLGFDPHDLLPFHEGYLESNVGAPKHDNGEDCPQDQ